MDVKEILALSVVLSSFVSLWVLTYYTFIDQPDTQKRHVISVVMAVLGAALLAWMLSPSDGATGISWGWLLLGMLVALFLVVVACAAPGASRDVLASHNAPGSTSATKARSKKRPASTKPTRAIRNGWSIGVVEFTYEDSAGDISYRTVTVHSASTLYLKGECHDRQAERTFRLDRIIGDLTDCETGEILSPKQWVRKNS